MLSLNCFHFNFIFLPKARVFYKTLLMELSSLLQQRRPLKQVCYAEDIVKEELLSLQHLEGCP